MIENLYHYEAKLIRCVDGDTAWMMLDCGFRTFAEKNVRLARIDAYERRGEEREKGIAATEYAKNLYAQAANMIVRSLEVDSFGRAIAEVYLKIEGEWRNLSDELVSASHAVYREY